MLHLNWCVSITARGMLHGLMRNPACCAELAQLTEFLQNSVTYPLALHIHLVIGTFTLTYLLAPISILVHNVLFSVKQQTTRTSRFS